MENKDKALNKLEEIKASASHIIEQAQSLSVDIDNNINYLDFTWITNFVRDIHDNMVDSVYHYTMHKLDLYKKDLK